MQDVSRRKDKKKKEKSNSFFIPRGVAYITSPFDDYNARVTEFDLERLIGDAGFSFSYERGEKRFYKREGSTNKQGANLIYRNGVYMFYPFSNNGNIEGRSEERRVGKERT